MENQENPKRSPSPPNHDEEAYERAWTIFAGKVEAADALKEAGRLEESVCMYLGAMEVAFPGAGAGADLMGPLWNNLGCALRDLGRVEEALECYRRGLELQPGAAALHVNLGVALRAAGRLDEAASAYVKALECDPRSWLALNNLGNLFRDRARHDKAARFYRLAVEVAPGFALGHNNLGTVLSELGRAVEAVGCFKRALELRPDYREAFSNLLLCSNYLHGLSAGAVFALHREFDARFGSGLRARWPQHSNLKVEGRRLRVGFVSGDLREHPVAGFIEPVFAHHRREAFEFFVYFTHPTGDAVSARLQGLVSGWRAVGDLADEALLRMVQGDGIDILVDLSGHTAHNRLGVFALKPAPVQVSMIGYMQTTGLCAMDYRITSEAMDPTGAVEHLNSEKLVRIPSLAAYAPPPDSPGVNASPAAKAGRVTFASFNTLSKVGPEVLETWARILKAVPDSQILIVGRAGNQAGALLEQFGVEPGRIVFSEYQPMKVYLEMHHQVDLVLDAFPYTGGTVNFLSAWMGVPFISLRGEGGPRRYGHAILEALGIGELSAGSIAEYEAKAVELAGDLERLAWYRSELRARLMRAIGDGEVYTRHLEEAFREMWRRWCRGTE